MATTIFVNLAVIDLDRSRSFFESLGYSINEEFSDENAVSVVAVPEHTDLHVDDENSSESTHPNSLMPSATQHNQGSPRAVPSDLACSFTGGEASAFDAEPLLRYRPRNRARAVRHGICR